MWKVGASVATLLGALFYGIGRFLADGFYTHLNTTAGAAGVNTISIIEPAAVLGAMVALLATAILMLLDVLEQGFIRIWRHAGTAWAVAVALAVLAGFVVFAIHFNYGGDNLTVIATSTAIGSLAWAYLIMRDSSRKRRQHEAAGEGAGEAEKAEARPGTEADAGIKIAAGTGAEAGGGAGAPANSQTGAPAGAVTVRPAGPVSNPWPRVIVVGLTAVAIVSLCIGAHFLGVHEANQVKKGYAVHISEAGLDISSVSAIPVRLQSVDPGNAIKSVSAHKCLLEIGVGANDLVLYDASNHKTISVPPSDVVIVSLNASTHCVNAATGH
jgi:hypothetical protein